MQRYTASFTISSTAEFKTQMLNWANQFNICCFLDDSEYHQNYHRYDCLLGVGANKIFPPANNLLAGLQAFCNGHNDWLFGHFNYEFKNEVEPPLSGGGDGIGFPEVFLFQPETVIEITGLSVVISCINAQPAGVFEKISAFKAAHAEVMQRPPEIKPRIEKEAYLSIIQKLRQHILRGDCYEINFCQEFFADNVVINPLQVYKRLSEISPTPFSCFYKISDKYLLCASPERYVKKTGSTIISQPIKGTIKRNIDDAADDVQLKKALQNSAKDRSENVMVVDLVRNDLSKICTEASVKVKELFGIYSFPQVYQMISTIEGELREGTSLADILTATFPMGSMTGAPKKRVMELIEQYEPVKRGIFSGAVGYITPAGDIDLNVVIRSIMYNAHTKYLNYLVGSGITFYSDAASEYEECLVKAQAMQQALK